MSSNASFSSMIECIHLIESKQEMRMAPETILYEMSEQPLILSGYKFLLLIIKQKPIIKNSIEKPAKVTSIHLFML